jgi:hypothetical protein
MSFSRDDTHTELETLAPSNSQLLSSDREWLERNMERLQHIFSSAPSGTFTTSDGKTVTVVAGIIVGIVS